MAKRPRSEASGTPTDATGAAQPNPLLGVWRITWMENWNQKTFDLCGPAFFKFDDSETGDFRFIAVTGSMRCRYGEEAGASFAKFKWSGHDDCDVARGDGWVRVEPDGSLRGHIEIKNGDESDFTAIRMRDGVDPLKNQR